MTDAIARGAVSSKSRWRLQARLRAACGTTLLVILALTLWELMPTDRGSPLPAFPPDGGPALDTPGPNTARLLDSIRTRRLFEPDAPLPSRSGAKRSVDAIKKQLKAHVITTIDNEPVAYIHIEKVGMKPYRVGEGEEGMFSVIRIDSNSVELEILGERVTLEM